jgi:hypothetical protein
MLASLGSLFVMFAYRANRLYVENVPPSPSLSACRMMTTYFRVTVMRSVHIIMERIPTRSALLGGLVKVLLKT